MLSSHKDSIIYDSNQKLDFTAGVLNPTILREFGLNQENVNLVSEGLKVNLKKELDYSKLKPKPNNRNLVRNRPIVRRYLSSLEESGSISRVNFKPLIVSPLNLVPKPNGAPRLIHDLSRSNKFLSRGPKVKHLNIFKLSSNFSNNTFFTKLDFVMDIFISLYILPIEHTLSLVLTGSITYLMSFVLVIHQPPTIFRILWPMYARSYNLRGSHAAWSSMMYSFMPKVEKIL